jgi:hypothetical protein
VLVSGWAHVLHAQYKPWGAGSVLYSLQHGALFVTSFVFLMGLLFKVDGVSSSGAYLALSSIMVTLCASFLAAWVAVIVARVMTLCQRNLAGKGKEPRRRSRYAIDRGTGTSARASSAADAGDDRDLPLSGGSGVSDDAGSQTVRPSDGFIVVNPLRHVKADGSGRVGGGAIVSDTTRAIESGTAEVHDDICDDSVQRHTVPRTLAVSRLQRVLAAQQPVPASTR